MNIRKFHHTMVQFVAAYVLALIGIGLMAAGMLLPPMGFIDPTVLAAFGEIATFAAAVMGMDYHYGNRKADNEKDAES